MSKEEFGDDEPLFEEGDQDYASANGWNPQPAWKERLEIDKKKNPRAYNTPQMLYSRPLQTWIDIAVDYPPVKPLFGPFWQNEELCILFAGTGLGKSALAVQIAESIARGRSIAPFSAPTLEPQNVLFLDFELKLTQLAMRYACIGPDGFEHRYQFSPRLFRSEMFWNGHVLDGYDGFSDMFFTSIRNEVERCSAKVLIVDNITFLDRSSTSNTNIALSIMRGLTKLGEMNPLSILVLAHTPKRRPWEPLTELDLQGSINLANFADSMFAMGRSRRGSDLRYLKQIKVRSGPPEYDSENVPVFSLGKFDYAASLGLEFSGSKNFLGFEFVGFDQERTHTELSPRTAIRSDTKKGAKRNTLADTTRLAAAGRSPGQIAEELGISRATAYRYLSRMASGVA